MLEVKNKDIANYINKDVSSISRLSKRNKQEFKAIKLGVFCGLNDISELDLKRLALDKQIEKENRNKN